MSHHPTLSYVPESVSHAWISLLKYLKTYFVVSCLFAGRYAGMCRVFRSEPLRRRYSEGARWRCSSAAMQSETLRRIILSSFDPEICVLVRLKQRRFPVLFITGMPYADWRHGNLYNGIAFASSFGLAVRIHTYARLHLHVWHKILMCTCRCC
jgi:hypothetical protein